MEQVYIHVALSFTAILAVALAAVRPSQPWLTRSIKHFTAWDGAVAVSNSWLHVDWAMEDATRSLL